jgi:beta-N-acetylhexosaminidase
VNAGVHATPGWETEVGGVDPGALLMVGIPGPALDRTTRRRLARIRPGGIILFRRNVRSLAQLRRLCTDLHRADPRILIGIDHEGGRVNRLPPPFTAFPPAATVAAGGSPRVAFAVGRAMGRELASVGIDIDFAPVLDVLTHPRNRVIGDRAFGRTPAQVATFGLALARGLRAGGVVPCGKHFPGHGATRGDSHVVLPRVRRSRRDLVRIDLAPFRRAVAARIPCLMTAHVLYPALDRTSPASLSRPIVTGILRRALGFRGVIVSDDLEMGAVAHRLAPEEAAVRAVAAGTDMLLVCADLGVAERAREGLTAALADGRISRPRLREAAARIDALGARRRPRSPIVAWPAPAHVALDRRLREPPAPMPTRRSRRRSR